MTRSHRRLAFFASAWASLAFVVVSGLLVQPAEAQKSAEPDLSEYRTVDQAIKMQVSKSAAMPIVIPAYLGVHAASDGAGKLIIGNVDAGSPAAKAGLKQGDQVVSVAERAVANADMLREVLRTKSPGDSVKVAIVRNKQNLNVTASLAPISKLALTAAQRPTMGIQLSDPKDGGLPVRDVTVNGPADKAGLKKDDILLKIEGRALNELREFQDIVTTKRIGDTLTVTYRRDDKDASAKVTLVSEDTVEGKSGSFDVRSGKGWKKPLYRLAIIGVEYTDVKHNAKVTAKDWEESMFSLGTYNKAGVLGQKVHGSMHDYYKEQSFGKLKLEGKMFPFVQVSKKRMDYATGNQNKTAMFTEAFEKLLARDGKDALNDFDGVFFIYAGGRAQVARGSLYWPHRSNFKFGGKSWPYFIVQEGGDKMNDISVFCHEFGHMLGLPDLYARPENPGSEGVYQWCAMANQVGGGRPQHFCAWSKEQLGWITPCVIDPAVKQKLILSPIEDSPKECFKIPARADGSEYFLIENRKKKGFDSSLPAEGLLVWRVVGNRPILEESHGVEGPAGPRSYLTSVPYPSGANDSFTPYTVPSSRAQLGNGLSVHITNIRRLPDGRITFQIGYEYH